MIKTIALTKIYATDEVETTALNLVDLTIKKGEFVSIMGESGCGKSTLLNVLGLLDKPTEGQYFFDEDDVSNISEKDRSKLRKASMGFIFQSFNLIDELNVFENVELPLIYLKVPKNERKKQVEEVLLRVGIHHRSNHFPQQLSGGQQQRVAIARAVVANPKIIFADEPTGNLDSHHGKEVMELLTQLNNQGTTIVMVTHSQRDSAYSDRIIRLSDGKKISETSNQRNLIL